MFLRQMIRKKDGKEHRYFSVVENKRVADGRVVQRHVLYLGEINDTQQLAWRKSIEVFDEGAAQPRTLSLFPDDRCEGVLPDTSIIRLRLSQMRLCRPGPPGAPQSDAMGCGFVGSGGLPVAGAGERVAVAP